jgi:hypothetical protein
MTRIYHHATTFGRQAREASGSNGRAAGAHAWYHYWDLHPLKSTSPHCLQRQPTHFGFRHRKMLPGVRVSAAIRKKEPVASSPDHLMECWLVT